MERTTRPDTITTEDLTRALFGIAGIRREVRRRAGIEQIPVGLSALGAIHRIGPARVSDVAAELQVDLSVASRQVQALESDGHIDRAPDPADRRSSLVSLSAAGREVLHGVHERLTVALNDAMAEWTPEEVAALVTGLLRLRADLAGSPACSLRADDPDPARRSPAPTQEQSA